MVTGKPRRAGIEVEVAMRFPVDLLRGIRLDDAVAAAHGPHPSAGPRARFEDSALVARFAEAVGRRHAGNAGAQDHDALAVARPRRQLGWRGVRRRRGQQPHHVQGRIDSRRPGDAPYQPDTTPPRNVRGHSLLHSPHETPAKRDGSFCMDSLSRTSFPPPSYGQDYRMSCFSVVSTGARSAKRRDLRASVETTEIATRDSPARMTGGGMSLLDRTEQCCGVCPPTFVEKGSA